MTPSALVLEPQVVAAFNRVMPTNGRRSIAAMQIEREAAEMSIVPPIYGWIFNRPRS